jgi:hypothetical protein
MIKGVLILLLLGCKPLAAQYFPVNNYPQNYFRNPLGIPLSLSGNFGQLRNDHFHMGLDIRTQQKENLPVYAAAEGYISRIKIEQYGYGQAIYINHPNGYTTLYAHLNSFYPALQNWLVQRQLNSKSWEQDIELAPGQFTVSKGQLIALSGNTGGSRGPHLHFEIRETVSGKNLNPLLFNFGIQDKTPPEFKGLYWYNRHYSTYMQEAKPIGIKGAKGWYIAKDSLIVLGSNKISFGLNVRDFIGSGFIMGIYQCELWLDEELKTAFRQNNYLYADSRYINACIDYPVKKDEETYIQHLSKLPGNYSPIFPNTVGNGVLELLDTLPHKVEIIAKDAAGNFATLQFTIQYNPALAEQFVFTDDIIPIPPNKTNTLQNDFFGAEFNPLALYDTLPFKMMATDADKPHQISANHSFGDTRFPLHTYNKVTIKAEKTLPTQLYNKVVLVQQRSLGNMAFPISWQNNHAIAQINGFGNLQLVVDTLAPTITPLGFTDSSKLISGFTVLIKDDISEIHQYAFELDGNWIITGRKNNQFIHHFSDTLVLGWHHLKITATDLAGNTSIQQYWLEKVKPVPAKKISKKISSKNSKHKYAKTRRRK